MPYRLVLYWHEVRVERLDREVQAIEDQSGGKSGGPQSVAGGGYDVGMLQALAKKGAG